MFKRRDKLPLHKRIMGYLWPRTGWQRSGRFFLFRLSRLQGSHDTLARSVACGIAMSFTPFIGFHFALSMTLAWLIRGNFIAAAIGTVAGNPWTFPFIWAWLYNLGLWMDGLIRDGESPKKNPVNLQDAMHLLKEAIFTWDFSTLGAVPMSVLWPMTLASIPTAIIVWVVSYYVMNRFLERIFKERHKKS